MSMFEDYFFGPLTKNWCNYFYVFTIIFFVISLASLGYLIFLLATKSKPNPIVIMLTVELIVASFILYIEKRLLHGMCIR